LAYISAAESIGVSSTTLYLQPLLRNPSRKLQNSVNCDVVRASYGLLRHLRSSKVTEFGTNRKLVYMRLPISD